MEKIQTTPLPPRPQAAATMYVGCDPWTCSSGWYRVHTYFAHTSPSPVVDLGINVTQRLRVNRTISDPESYRPSNYWCQDPHSSSWHHSLGTYINFYLPIFGYCQYLAHSPCSIHTKKGEHVSTQAEGVKKIKKRFNEET